MASLSTLNNEMSVNQIEIPIHANNIEPKPSQDTEENNIDYSQRAQWLHAAALGASYGLVLVTLLMMSVGAVNEDNTAMFLVGLAGLVAGACSMAIGEFVSVYNQLDIMVAQMKIESGVKNGKERKGDEDDKLPNPYQATIASAIAFSFGAALPLLAAVCIRDYKIRLAVFAAVASLALLVFGRLGAVLGKSPVRRYCQSADWRLDGHGYYFWLDQVN